MAAAYRSGDDTRYRSDRKASPLDLCLLFSCDSVHTRGSVKARTIETRISIMDAMAKGEWQLQGSSTVVRKIEVLMLCER